jgi:hypothetical protein
MEQMRHTLTQPMGKMLPLRDRLSWRARSVCCLIDVRSCIAFVLPLIIYILTLAPTIYALDSAELTTAAASGGITRSTGYPFYLLLGNLFARIPVGDIGYRMNLLSAICGALTIALAERILRRLRVNNWAIFGALGLLAFSTHFWGLSLIAEVYTLHAALMAALILALLRWSEQPTSRSLTLVGLLLGLSLAHHGATLLLLPGILFFIVHHFIRKSLPLTHLIGAAGAMLLGGAFYLYLPARYAQMPAFNYAGMYDAAGIFHPIQLNRFEGLWQYISSQSFSDLMFAYRPAELLAEAQNYMLLLWRTFLAIGIGPGLVGMIYILRHNRPFGIALFLMFACNALFFIDYRVVDKETMFLPTFLVWSLWLGMGYHELRHWLQDTHLEKIYNRSIWIFNGIISLAVVASLFWNWRLVDQSHNRSARQYGEQILQEVEPGALLLGYWDVAPIVEYLQIIEGRRPDVTVINRFLISPQDLAQLIQQEASHHSVYIDSLSADLELAYEFHSVGHVYSLTPRDPAASTMESTTRDNHECNDGLEYNLNKYEDNPNNKTGGS